MDRIGEADANGVSVRRVEVVAGIMLIGIAFVPGVLKFLIHLPPAVGGVLLIYTVGFMMVSGMELILSRLLNSSRRTSVGLGPTAGVTVLMMPELTAFAPSGLKPILGSGLTLGVMVSAVLNLAFGIGSAKKAGIRLDEINPLLQAA